MKIKNKTINPNTQINYKRNISTSDNQNQCIEIINFRK